MKGLKTVIYSFFILALLLAGCAPAAHLHGARATGRGSRYTQAFTRTDCWFTIPAKVVVDCGYVQVLEDRTQPASERNIIRLAVAVFHSRTNSPSPDPILYQVGGPGGHMLGIVPYIFDRVIAPLLVTRDVIFFDPRGTGLSQPALECKAGEEPGSCLRRLFAEGRNLYAYNSASMAKDLQDIRDAFGYNQWNLFGESYGTHVAQVAMRESPEGLRSVILDSVMPIVYPKLPKEQPSYFHAALQRLFQSCRGDPACNGSYPNLEEKLRAITQWLDSHPVNIEPTCYGKRISTQITGDRFISMLFNAMYETEQIADLPNALTAAADDSNYFFWNQIVCWETMIDDYLLSNGAHWAVMCGDGKLGEPCEDWPVVVECEPASSRIPTLILNGEFDPVTPLEFGHAVAKTLPNSYSFDFPGFGHWINGTGHPCQNAIIQVFLDNPQRSPDAGCLKGLEMSIFTR